MPSVKDRLSFILEGGAVNRFHSRPGIKSDTDAEHQYRVAMLVTLLSPNKPTANLLLAALTHDLGEQASSDVSAPAKRAMSLSSTLQSYESHVRSAFHFNYEVDLTADEFNVLKLADNLDGMLYCVRERTLGNTGVQLIWNKWMSYIQETLLTDHEVAVYLATVALYKEALLGGSTFDVYDHV